MRIPLLLPALPLLLAACQRVDRSPPDARGDTAGIAAASAETSSSALTTDAPITGGPLDPALDSACTLAMRLTRDALKLTLVRDTATTFTSPREIEVTWHGCRLTASSPGVQKDAAHPVMPDGPLQAAFLGAGWKDDFDYGADGPDGTELGMRKGDILCHLAVSYPDRDAPDDDSGDSSASQPPAAIPYSLVIRCTNLSPLAD